MDLLLSYAPLLARGALTTLALALISLALATFLGAAATLARLAGGSIGGAVTLAYTTLVRGVPDLVMMLIVYFGGQRLLNALLGALGGAPVAISAFSAGVLAIGFIYGAYLAETFRGAFQAIPAGQLEAGRALGLRGLPLAWRVITPQLVRLALPGYANVWQVLVKSTAVVSVIGLEDLVGLASDAGKTARAPFLFLIAVLGFYLLLTFASQQVFDWLQRRHSLVGHAR